MRTRIIGIGAAGNKAAISAVEDGIDKIENILLVNSTLKDIPSDFKGQTYCFQKAYGGCGKERNKAKQLMLKDLESDAMKLEQFLGINTDNQAELVVLVSSTEGGTGSGSVPILASYINNVYHIPVHCFAFTGFEEDGRGLMNTVEYFQEMEEGFTVECLQNNKFMKECNNNRIKAEQAANAEFCKKISILFGNPLRDSDHNIDPTDLLKVSAKTPGYMVIEFRQFSKVKNRESFRAMIQDMIDESKALDINEPSQRRIAVMINIDKNSTDIIDYLDILIDSFGMCFEKYEHIQYEEEMPEFVAFISAGHKIPVKEIEAVYDKYKQYTVKVNKNKDSFFAKKFDFDEQDAMFNMEEEEKKPVVDKSAFFKNAMNKKKPGEGRHKEVKDVDVEDGY